jgi:hypothetical protein
MTARALSLPDRCQVRHVVEGLEHQQRVLEFLGGELAEVVVREQADQRFDVVAAVHVAEQFHGFVAGDQRAFRVAPGDGGEESPPSRRRPRPRPAAPDRLSNSSRNASSPGRRVLQQFHQIGDLLGIQRLRWDIEFGAFGDVFTIGLQHGDTPVRVSAIPYVAGASGFSMR